VIILFKILPNIRKNGLGYSQALFPLSVMNADVKKKVATPSV